MVSYGVTPKKIFDMEVQDHSDMTNSILVAVTDIKGQPRQVFMLGWHLISL
jgi:hypothetical protein